VDEPVFVVVNPRSGKGRGGRVAKAVLEAFGQPAHGESQAPGDEARVAREALARGFRRIVAVGGDGTWGNVAGAIVESGIPAKLGLIAGGTGCDLAKSLDIPASDPAACARIVSDGHARAIDAGRVEDRYFFNIAGFGLDIAVLEDSWRVRWLRGDLLYLYCALRQMYRYPGFQAELSVESGPTRKVDLLMLIVANARYFGGAFRIAPGADLGDGRLDAMCFANMPFARRFPLMGALVRGRHEQATEVEAIRASRFRLTFPAPPAYETDGEWVQAKSREVDVACIPGALQVLVPRP
jgi:diacylglycerol kinase (ATP)